MPLDIVEVNFHIDKDVVASVNLNEVFMEMSDVQKRTFLGWCLDDLGLELKEK